MMLLSVSVCFSFVDAANIRIRGRKANSCFWIPWFRSPRGALSITTKDESTHTGRPRKRRFFANVTSFAA
uniref:Putative secreted protein n=1 Tax=Anopheles marajoara TaxID=58244 RepID=A0A2M4CFS0_9DIPT